MLNLIIVVIVVVTHGEMGEVAVSREGGQQKEGWVRTKRKVKKEVWPIYMERAGGGHSKEKGEGQQKRVGGQRKEGGINTKMCPFG